MLSAITKTSPVDNEFFIKDNGVYFCGIYEDTLLKGVSPADFHCWHYWGKSSSSCYMGGIRLRGADAASFQALNYAYAMDISAVYTTSGRIAGADTSTFQILDNGQNDSGAPQGYAKDKNNVYFHNGDGKVKVLKTADVCSFQSLGDTYFAKDCRHIYAYGKILPKADLNSWKLIGHLYSCDDSHIYYVNRKISAADRKSFRLYTPLTAPSFCDLLARDDNNCYINDEIIDESYWLDRLKRVKDECMSE